MDLKQLLIQTTIKKDISDDEVTQELIPNDEGVSNDQLESDVVKHNDTVDSRFLQPWNKLEKGMKMNRILLFVEHEKINHTLSDTTEKELKNLLFRACEEGLFNKLSDVKYNEEIGLIDSFKQLEFNESSKKYKLRMSGTKKRSVSKSRSNIDRLMRKNN